MLNGGLGFLVPQKFETIHAFNQDNNILCRASNIN